MTYLSYKPLLSIGDSVKSEDIFDVNRPVNSMLATSDDDYIDKLEKVFLNNLFVKYESDGCNPIIVNPELVHRASLTAPYHVPNDVESMSSPLAVIAPERYSIPSFFTFVGRLKDLNLDSTSPGIKGLINIYNDNFGDEPIFICWYNEILVQTMKISKLQNIFESGSSKWGYEKVHLYRTIWNVTMNITSGIKNNRFVFEDNIPKGIKYRYPNSITGNPSVKCVMLRDPNISQTCPLSDNTDTPIKDQIKDICEKLGEPKVNMPVSRVKQKLLLRDLKIKLDKKLELEKKKAADNKKLKDVKKAATVTPVVSKPKLQKQTKEHVHPKEYPQFVDLVIGLKDSGYTTRDAIYNACLDMNREIVDPATFYRWKDLVEKEREKGSELISDEEANLLKGQITPTGDIDLEIQSLQESLGMELKILKSTGEKEAYLSMLKQLDGSIPKVKHLRQSICKYAARVGVHVDESRITGRKPTYDYLQELKQEYLQNKSDIVKPKTSTINKPYCANKECSNKVDYHNTLCHTCKTNNINIEVPTMRTCTTEGCNGRFTTPVGSDRIYCATCLTKRSKTIGDEVIMSKPGVSDFVEYFLLYLTEDYGLMDSIHEAATKANVQEPDDLHTIAIWCKKYGEPIGETRVSETGRVYRNGMLRSKFASCYLEILSLSKYNKSESCKILSDIMGTEPVPTTLVNNWINEFELTDNKEKADVKSKTIHHTDDETVVKIFIQSASREEIKMLSELVDARKKELLKDLEEEIERLKREREQYFK